MDSSSTPADEAYILRLNEDCLYKVFDQLGLLELTAMAEVSSAFRQTAQTYARSKYKELVFPLNSCVITTEQALLDLSRVLRMFGASVESVTHVARFYYWNDWGKPKFQRKFIELLIRFCGATLIELKLDRFNINEEITLLMRPLIERVHKLNFFCCIISAFSLKVLPLWSLELKELVFTNIEAPKERASLWRPFKVERELELDGLHQPFRKLEKIHFSQNVDLENWNVEEIMRCNSQLKDIKLYGCCPVDFDILDQMVRSVPELEVLQLIIGDDEPIGNTHYFAQFRNLTELELSFSWDSPSDAVSLISELVAASIPLTRLWLAYLSMENKANDLVEGISKLKTLKSLALTPILGLNATHSMHICEQLGELIDLFLNVDCQLSSECISDMIRSAGKLEKLEVTLSKQFGENVVGTTCIDVGTFFELVNVLRARPNKSHLEMLLEKRAYVICVPENVSREHKDVLTVQNS